ncbi:MAG: prepilin-type N-terminal cleavage/methylation domain-containing protein [Patescibacteria group bacterium]|nr:prepilin-type N-terminal cleavage/methylation domain-containing protein [Patescibacteria group bacterium]
MKSFNLSIFKFCNSREGFTLLELLVVFGIITLLSTGLLFYNRTTESQLILYKDQSKIIGALEKAKAMSIESFSETTAACGYGVSFSAPNNIVIFKDLSPSNDPNCLDINFAYNGDPAGDCQNYAECAEKISLDKNISFSQLDLNNIVFIPPDPAVVIDNNPSKSEGVIKIKYSNNNSEKSVKVSASGQITAQ